MSDASTKPTSIVPPAIKAERDRFAALSFCWADVLLELDDEKIIVFAVGASAPLIGYKPQDLIGKSLNSIIAEQDCVLVKSLMGVAGKSGRIDNITVRFKNPNGVAVPVHLAGYQMPDLGAHYFLALRKAPARVGRGEKGRPVRDAESGLFDADSFGQVVKKRVQAAAQGGQESHMTLIELGEFEELQKRLGEDAEHDLFNTVGACLRASSLDGDSAAKIADNRFGLIHGDDVDIDALKKQISEVTKQFDPEGKGADVGVATVDVETSADVSEEDLANGLVYAINRFKSSKGGEFNIHNLSSQLGDLVSQASDTVNDFKRIVANKDFEAAFQPIVDVLTKKVHHYEALVRFEFDKTAASTSPYETITFAEETGLIPAFDLAMVEKVVERLSETPINSNISVAVNVSGSSVASPMYVEGLRKILKANTWARGRLMFEITESSRMADLDHANSFIQELRKAGHHVCLDDFGAGAANFEYLSTLEVDVVKLDGPVVKNAFKAHKGRAFMKALVGLCRDLGVETIAEMIDSDEGFAFIKDCGVEYAQGYLFGKPSYDLQGYGGKKAGKGGDKAKPEKAKEATERQWGS